MKDKFNIDDAIEHTYEKADELSDCECGEWHKQLGDWLVELKKMRNDKERIDMNKKVKYRGYYIIIDSNDDYKYMINILSYSSSNIAQPIKEHTRYYNKIYSMFGTDIDLCSSGERCVYFKISKDIDIDTIINNCKEIIDFKLTMHNIIKLDSEALVLDNGKVLSIWVNDNDDTIIDIYNNEFSYNAIESYPDTTILIEDDAERTMFIYNGDEDDFVEQINLPLNFEV